MLNHLALFLALDFVVAALLVRIMSFRPGGF